MPAALAKRSAEARAKKTGEPVEAVLAEWAGIDPATVASGTAPAPAPAAPAAAAVAATPEDQDEPATEGSDEIEVIEPAATGGDDDVDAVDKVSTPAGRYPTWLAAAFLIIPLLAVTYIVLSPNGPDCGSGGQLLVNPVTGDAVNCDGSDYGTITINYLANGAAIYTQCAACHSADGSGGAGPAFVGGSILTTFPAGSCADQIEWITLGTAEFPEPTYGATNKPVGGFGVMPTFGKTLEPSQIAQVALYERVQFGDEPVEEAEVDCGLVDEEGVPIALETIDAADG
jgi:Cytochrome c